jgi:hypothetical protein
MGASVYLRYVTYGCIFVSYGPSDRARKSRTPQPCTRTVAALRPLARRRRANGERLRHFSTTSLSLFAASAAPDAAGSRRRCEGGIHRQAFPRIGSAPSSLREPHRFVVERDREPSAPCGFAAETKAWLSGSHRATTRFILNIASIVCLSRNWSKSTNFSFPRYAGRLDRQN